MKRILSVLSLVTLLLLSSCNKEDPKGSISSFKAIIEDYSEVFTWNNGDAICVSNGSSVSDFTFDDSAGLFMADNAMSASDHLQAIYPASSAEWEGECFRVIVPEKQVATQNGDVSIPMFLWRQSEDGFRFRSLYGKVIISINGSGTALYDAALSEVVFTSTGNPACGIATVSKDGTLSFSQGSQTLTIECGEGMNVHTPIVFLLPCHKYPMGSKVTFKFADGKTIESETIMGIVPRRGMTKAYGIEVTADFFGPLEEYEDGGSLDNNYSE